MSTKPEITHPNAKAFPAGLSGPALRALARAGIRSMDDLAGWSSGDLAALHGMGPKAMRQLTDAERERVGERGVSTDG